MSLSNTELRRLRHVGDQVQLNCRILTRVVLVSSNLPGFSEHAHKDLPSGRSRHPTGHLRYKKQQSATRNNSHRQETVSLTLLFRHFLPSNQVPVGCPKNQKLPLALRPFKFLERERETGDQELARQGCCWHSIVS